jgi:hypothetical protein
VVGKEADELDEERYILSLSTLSWSSFTGRFPWWAGSVTTVAILGAFTLYTLFVVFFQPVAQYPRTDEYLFSPMYSPPIPGPFDWLRAAFVLWVPLGFRLTCYYYRKAYYRAFLWDPPNCSSKAQQREPRNVESYEGERNFWVFNNVHRYFLYGSFVVVAFLWYETIRAFFPDGFGITVGSLIFLLNVILLSGYTFGCHAMRHLVGGRVDCYSCVMAGNARRKAHHWVSLLTGGHMFWAWTSLFSVWGADVYIRLLMSGAITDLRFV